MDRLERLYQQQRLNLSGQAELSDANAWADWRKSLYRHDWVVYAKRPFDRPEYLIRYLGRYIKRIAIANHRLQRIDNASVCFDYHDNRDDQDKVMRLSAETFIGRFLRHILPRQFRRIRYYGFLVNSQRKQKLALCRQLLGLDPDVPFIPDIEDYLSRQGYDSRTCPHCGEGILHNIFHILSFHDPPSCFGEGATS
jgi:hypothetical protein